MNPIKILLIEDNLMDARKVRAMLEETGAGKFELSHVDRLNGALKRLTDGEFDVVLLDMSSTSDESGLESISYIERINPEIPIVALSEDTDEAFALKVVQAGAQDYLVKGQGDGFLIARTIRYAIEHKKEKERLTVLAQYDLLTGLANRVLFRDLLEKALARSDRNKMPVGLMFLDLDRFKIINDTLGHDFGDSLLKFVAQRLKSCVRTGDLISRLGGDEFTVTLEGLTRIEDVEIVAQKILHTLARPFDIEGHDLSIGVSIGVAVYPSHGKDADTLIKYADTAMYSAKENGRNNYKFYTQVMGKEMSKQHVLENDLRRALECDEFLLYYQPQLSLKTQEIVGVEALIRWQRDKDKIVVPGGFIPLAEETGLIVQIGEWVLQTACKQNKEWQDSGLSPIRIAVNLSARQLCQKDIIDIVKKALTQSGLNPEFLELELTESLIMEDMQARSVILAKLKNMGVHISIDDFGTGYSSLSCLETLPIDTLKIDKSFIRKVSEDPENATIASAIIALGQAMRLNVIAEGIENKSQVDYLISQGCSVGQGYYYAKPMPAAAFTEYWTQNLDKKVAVS